MDEIHKSLEQYAEPLLREVAERLLKPRNRLEPADIIERCVATLTNAPVIDRRIRDLSEGPRFALAAASRTGRTEWEVGHVMALASAFGHANGFSPIRELLTAGLIYPSELTRPISQFDEWFATSGSLQARCLIPPSISLRARSIPLPIPSLDAKPLAPCLPVDGLDWPLRLAVVWQSVQAEPVRVTRGGSLYKKDRTRFESNPVLTSPDHAAVPDVGLLGLFWAEQASLLDHQGEHVTAAAFPAPWRGTQTDVIRSLTTALFGVKFWDPGLGYTMPEENYSSFATGSLFALLLLTGVPDGQGLAASAIAEWLWEHHPSWSAVAGKSSGDDAGTTWVRTFFTGLAIPLGIVEGRDDVYRLTPLGKHLVADHPAPAAAPVLPQTLLVQPNAQILAYRQGLTPELIAQLSRFAAWQGIGPACTLELTSEQTYRGLESGLTIAEVLQTLQKHGTRPVPAAVDDLLRRWGSKRERITAFNGATLVEFTSPADLDLAIERGIVSIRLTDRIGLTADGREPDFRALRLIGNRDYEARSQPCLRIDDDGVTATVDAALADLLLDVELNRFTEPVPTTTPIPRRVVFDPVRIRSALDGGLALGELETWFINRTGQPIPPAVKLFAIGSNLPPADVVHESVVYFPTVEITDGVMQWPETARWIKRRLGETTVTVRESDLIELTNVLGRLGIRINGPDAMENELLKMKPAG